MVVLEKTLKLQEQPDLLLPQPQPPQQTISIKHYKINVEKLCMFISVKPSNTVTYFPLHTKLQVPMGYTAPSGDEEYLKGATELHRLALFDFDELKRRANEINSGNIDITCVDNFGYKEVNKQPPIPYL